MRFRRSRRSPRAPLPSFLVLVTATTMGFGFACTPNDRADFEPAVPGNNPVPTTNLEDPSADVGTSSFAHPDFGATVTQTTAPPALGAATLIVSQDGLSAIATDPDRDRVLIVNLANHSVKEVPLGAGDEPSRIVEDGTNRVHIALRRGGAVVTIDLVTSTVVARRDVCAAPQGIGISRSPEDTLFIACAGGELVRLPAALDQVATRMTVLDRDLRDVVVSGESLLVSRLRSAEVLQVHKTTGAVMSRLSSVPQALTTDQESELGRIEPRRPFVGWRLIGTSAGGATLVHQMATPTPVNVEQPNAYVAVERCSGTVTTATTSFNVNVTNGLLSAEAGAIVDGAVVPIDLTRARDGMHWAIIAAGNNHTRALQQVHIVQGFTDKCTVQRRHEDPPGQAAAVAFSADSKSVIVFTREPAALHIAKLSDLYLFSTTAKRWTTIPLGGASREDTGHAIFHSNAGGGIACVSCHPEGGDDGRVWDLSTGSRRTQSLKGTLAGTSPYHWGGDAPDMGTFARDVFAERMGGQALPADQVTALQTWLEHIPTAPIAPPSDAAAALRGKALFESTTASCSGCHAGAMYTNNRSVDVGTGGTFQVPSLLGVASRAPYLHNGCASSLLERFTKPACAGGDRHGKTSTLSSDQIKDLVSYLETL